MGKTVYGVNLDGDITPIDVRDAIVRCFKEAHKEVLDKKNRENDFESDIERENFEKIQVDLIIMSFFDDAKDDFNNPTKDGIKKVLGMLAEFASKYREPQIIKKHYNEIMKLVKRLK